MMNYLALNKPIGPSYNTDPNDVVQTKTALASSGHYQVPEHGISPYPDTPLINGIKSFQKENKLRVDGVMKPGGETEQVVNQVVTASYKRGDFGLPDGREWASSCIPKPDWKYVDTGVAWNPNDGWYYLCVKTRGLEKFKGQAMWIRSNRNNQYHK